MFIFAVMWLVGCAPPPYEAPATDPSITITWPPAESTAAGCAIVTVEIANFDVIDPALANGELVEGQGHYHVITPSGYDACYAPYCVADFTTMATDQQGELRALLVQNDHQAVLSPTGDPYQASILFNFEASAECGWSSEHYDTGDTGGHDSGG